MPAFCKLEPVSVTALLERHQAAWNKCRRQWDQRERHHSQEEVDAVTLAGIALNEAKPANLQEWLNKWFQIVLFENELELDGLDHIAVMGQMIDEVAALVEAPQ